MKRNEVYLEKSPKINLAGSEILHLNPGFKRKDERVVAHEPTLGTDRKKG